MSIEKIPSPIKSGWRGELNGHIEATDGSEIRVSHVDIKLDYHTAWALCNLLCPDAIKNSQALEGDQTKMMLNLGAAIGRLFDHPSANNLGKVLK